MDCTRRSLETYLGCIDCRNKIGRGQGAGERGEIGSRESAACARGNREHFVDDVNNTTVEGHISSCDMALGQLSSGKDNSTVRGRRLDDLPASDVRVRGVRQERLGKGRFGGDGRGTNSAGEDVVGKHSRHKPSIRRNGLVHGCGEESRERRVAGGQDGDIGGVGQLGGHSRVRLKKGTERAQLWSLSDHIGDGLGRGHACEGEGGEKLHLHGECSCVLRMKQVEILDGREECRTKYVTEVYYLNGYSCKDG